MGRPLQLLHPPPIPALLGVEQRPRNITSAPLGSLPPAARVQEWQIPIPTVSHCSSVVNHCFLCHVQLQRARLESRAFGRNSRRSAKALHCCRSPCADKTHPECTLLHPCHCIPAWELINKPRNLLGLALGITEWVWVF